jgi:superfamily I DNA/RNA helicase
LCDTSDENPRAGKPTSGSSRFNEYHKVCVLDIVQQILRTLPPLESLEEENARIGIVTPYREQANRIAKLIKAERLEKYVRVGTVHTFQGLEFETVIFDTVDSVGVTIRREFTGEGPRSGAMRLINVAITRAQHKLIIVANTRYLKEQQRQGYLAENATLMAAIQEARKAYTIMSHALLGMNFAGS